MSISDFMNKYNSIKYYKYWKPVQFSSEQGIIQNNVLYIQVNGRNTVKLALQLLQTGNLLYKNISTKEDYIIPFYNLDRATEYYNKILRG